MDTPSDRVKYTRDSPIGNLLLLATTIQYHPLTHDLINTLINTLYQCRTCMIPIFAVVNYTAMMSNKVLCSGSIYGSHYGMLSLFRWMNFLLSLLGNNDCMRTGMTDQLVMNIVAYNNTAPRYQFDPTLLNHRNVSIHIADNFNSPFLTIGKCRGVDYPLL